MVFRAIFIILNTLLSTYLLLKTDYLITSISSILLLVLQIYLLYIKEQRVKESVLSYLETSLNDESYNLKLTGRDNYSRKLNKTLHRLSNRIRKKEILYQGQVDLLEALLLHIKTGIIIFREDGEILKINRAARIMLGVNYIHSVNEIDEFKKINRFKNEINNELLDINGERLLLESSTINFNNQILKIVSIQDVNPILDKEELNSWNRLIRSLNHELMNSITPISSLATTAVTLLDENCNSDLVNAIKVIESRSRNLLKFVDSYKTLSQLPEPNRKLVKFNDLMKRVTILMQSSIRSSGVTIEYKPDDNSYLYVDESQMEQVFINLIKNSIEANSTKVSIYIDENRDDITSIFIRDNGIGFSKEGISSALIPFYTTKSEGSGLGLSIVRQILLINSGNIELINQEAGSLIKITFK